MPRFTWKSLRILPGALLVLSTVAVHADEPRAAPGRVRISGGNLPAVQTASAEVAAPVPAMEPAVAPVPVPEPGPIPAAPGVPQNCPAPLGDAGPYGGVPYGAGNVHYPSYGVPTRGYVSLNYTPRECCSRLGCRLQARTFTFLDRSAERRANLGVHLRHALSPLRPLTYWDLGSRCDNIAVDPGYTHPADSQIFAAQGYGVPMAVPLAPVVLDQYNYSWGVPSSRLTPVAVPPGF